MRPRLGHTRRVLLQGGVAAAAFAAAQLPSKSEAQGARLRADSTGDHTEALAKLIREGARAGQPVRLPPGRFRVDRLALPPGLNLVGSGPGTVLVQGGRGPILVAEAGGPIAASALALEGTAGGDASQPLLHASGIAALDLSRLRLIGARGTALLLERCGGRVADLLVEEADTGIHSLDATGLAIATNTVRRCSNNGIQVWTSAKRYDGTQVLANRIEGIEAKAGGSGEYGNGINVFRAGGVMVAQNTIRDCAFSAVRANAADNVQISSNQCAGLREVAIFVEFGFEGAVVANNLVDGASAGISVTNFDQGGRLASVTGNVIRNVVRRPEPITGRINQGYGIAAEADTVVSGNVVERAEFAGLLLGFGPYLRDVTCANNLVRAAGVGIAVSVAPGAGSAQITGNTLTGCRAGIVGFAWDDVVAGDLASAAARYPQLTVAGNNIRPTATEVRPAAR